MTINYGFIGLYVKHMIPGSCSEPGVLGRRLGGAQPLCNMEARGAA